MSVCAAENVSSSSEEKPTRKPAKKREEKRDPMELFSDCPQASDYGEDTASESEYETTPEPEVDDDETTVELEPEPKPDDELEPEPEPEANDYETTPEPEADETTVEPEPEADDEKAEIMDQVVESGAPTRGGPNDGDADYELPSKDLLSAEPAKKFKASLKHQLDSCLKLCKGKLKLGNVAERLKELEAIDDYVKSNTFDYDNFKLKKHQIAGVKRLNELKIDGVGVIIADEMGLGKTLTASYHVISSLEPDPSAKALILTPNSLRSAWKEELKKFFPKFNRSPDGQGSDKIFNVGDLQGSKDDVKVCKLF